MNETGEINQILISKLKAPSDLEHKDDFLALCFLKKIVNYLCLTPNLRLTKSERIEQPPFELFPWPGQMSIIKSDRAAYKTTRQAGENPARSIPILDL